MNTFFGGGSNLLFLAIETRRIETGTSRVLTVYTVTDSAARFQKTLTIKHQHGRLVLPSLWSIDLPQWQGISVLGGDIGMVIRRFERIARHWFPAS